MIRSLWVTSIVLLLLGTASADAQGTLQRVRDDVRSSSGSSDSGSSSSGDSPGGSFLNGLFSSDGDGGSLGGMLVGIAVLAPFYLPAALIGDKYEYQLPFTRYPYADGYHGYQILPLDLAATMYTAETSDVQRNNWAVRVAIENGNDFNGINRVGGQLKIETASRWGFVTNWNYYYERFSCGCTDETVIGDTNVTFRFAQNEVVSLYTGLGFRMMSDRKQTDFGFNFTYGGDWFPVRPIIVSAVFDAGTLGSAGVVHGRATVGAIWHGFELFAGYDFMRIGDVNLQGPMAGVRFWF